MKLRAVALASALALTLAACGGAGKSASETSNTTITGSGASSQAKAQQAWRDAFSKDKGIRVNYEATGSGTGREQFLAGQVSFAGTDKPLSGEEVEKATQQCQGGGIVELPMYISPIAIAYNLPGVEKLQLSADNVADIFSGNVTKWDDASIRENNPGVKLPDLPIIPVNRADKSGTTENFTEYLAAASTAWEHEPAEVWPIEGTQSAEKTSGVVQLASSVEGAITYADASQIGTLKAAAVQVGEDFLVYSPEAAAKIIDGSTPAADASDTILTYDLVRDGSVQGAYPIVLVSYLVGCQKYKDATMAGAVKDYFSFIASEEAQKAATAAGGGNAPISEQLREKVLAAVGKIG